MALAAEKCVGSECAATYSTRICLCSSSLFLRFLYFPFLFFPTLTQNGAFVPVWRKLRRSGMMTCFLTLVAKQAAQATFKSIRSLVPLLDRVLVQRFKPEIVRFLLPFFGEKNKVQNDGIFIDNGVRGLPPDFSDVEPPPGSDRDRRRPWRAG